MENYSPAHSALSMQNVPARISGLLIRLSGLLIGPTCYIRPWELSVNIKKAVAISHGTHRGVKEWKTFYVFMCNYVIKKLSIQQRESGSFTWQLEIQREDNRYVKANKKMQLTRRPVYRMECRRGVPVEG